MAITDEHIIEGLVSDNISKRPYFEKELYLKYKYFIEEGVRKHRLDYDDSFSAYSDAIFSVIINVIRQDFQNRSSLKTYLFQIYTNKCIDLVRKRMAAKDSVHHSASAPELLGQLPDSAKSVVEKLIHQQKVQQVRQFLNMIGEKCKEILLLFEDGYTDGEIALQLKYNNAAVVKTTRLRCLEKIKMKFNG